MALTHIAKALPPDERYLSYIYAITRQFLDDWAKGFRAYTSQLRQATTLTALSEALESGQTATLLSGIPWSEAEDTLVEAWTPLMDSVVARAGAAELRRLDLPLRFDIRNPFAERWVAQHAAELVVQVSDETKRAIRGLISESFELGVDTAKTGRRIREWVGLTERESKAVLRYWHKLNEDGARSASRANDMADTYSRRLWRKRAERIARNEIVTAANQGLHESFQMAQYEGYLLPETKRKWIAAFASDRTCEYCMELHGEEVGLEESFYSEKLGKSILHPPAHVMCRCSVGLTTPPLKTPTR